MFKIGGRAVQFSPSPPPLKPFDPVEALQGGQESLQAIENGTAPAHTSIEKVTPGAASPPAQDHDSCGSPIGGSDDAQRMTNGDDAHDAENSKGRSSETPLLSVDQARVTEANRDRSVDNSGVDEADESNVEVSRLAIQESKQTERDSVAPGPKAKARAQRPLPRQTSRAKQTPESKPATKVVATTKKAVSLRSRKCKASDAIVELETATPLKKDYLDGDEQDAPRKVISKRLSNSRASVSERDNEIPTSAKTSEAEKQEVKLTSLKSALKRGKVGVSMLNSNATFAKPSSEKEGPSTLSPQPAKTSTHLRPAKNTEEQSGSAKTKDCTVVAKPKAIKQVVEALPSAQPPTEAPSLGHQGEETLVQPPVVFFDDDDDEDLYAPLVETSQLVKESHAAAETQRPAPTKVDFVLPASSQASAPPKPALLATPPAKTGTVLISTRISTPANRRQEDARYGIYSSEDEADNDDGFEVVGEIGRTAAKQVPGENAPRDQKKRKSTSLDNAEAWKEESSSKIRSSAPATDKRPSWHSLPLTKKSFDEDSANLEDGESSERLRIKKKLDSRRPLRSVLQSTGDEARQSADRFGFSRSRGIVKAAVGPSVRPPSPQTPKLSHEVRTADESQFERSIDQDGAARTSSVDDTRELSFEDGVVDLANSTASPQITGHGAKVADLEGVISDSDGEAGNASETLANPFRSKKGRKGRASIKAPSKKTVESGLQDARTLLPFRRGPTEEDTSAAPAKKKRQLKLSPCLPGSDSVPSSDLSSLTSTSTTDAKRRKKAANAPRTSNIAGKTNLDDDYALPGGSTLDARRKTPARRGSLKAIAPPARMQSTNTAGSSRPRPRPSAESKKQGNGSDDWSAFNEVPAAAGSGGPDVPLAVLGKGGKYDEAARKTTPSSVLGNSRSVNGGFQAIDEYHLEVERV